MEEILREAACVGNLDGVSKVLQSGANINSQNSVNGWTALHWACKRGHRDIATFLLQSGADVNIAAHKGEKAVNLTEDPEIAKLVIVPDQGSLPASLAPQLPIVPNYLQSPPFPYVDVESQIRTLRCNGDAQGPTHSFPSPLPSPPVKDAAIAHQATPACLPAATSIVVRVRVAGSKEMDFVEVEVVRASFQILLETCCGELDVKASDVAKIRKLPDVLVRKDADVTRLTGGERLELVLTNVNTSELT